MTKSKPADIFLIAGGPESKNTKTILAEVLKSSNTNLQSKVYRDGKEEAWREALDLDCENVLNGASAETLAEIMTEAGVKPGTKGRLS